MENQANGDKTVDSPNSNSSEGDELNFKRILHDFSMRAYNSVLGHGSSIFSSSKSITNKKDDTKMDS